ncbi:3-isopropylmalate dehydrogenase [archaeon SCG-AAA382B04]|nr:3-isopropylmalate dehydrogenase [archaeon SCG-AAA382B04]
MYEVPVIPGDGIGPEIIREGKKVLEAAAQKHNFNIKWKELLYGAEHYLETGETLPEDALNELENHKAIYMGSVGDPRVEPGVLEKGILLKLRFYFDQYINLRPVKLLPGIDCPLKDPGEIDFIVLRENTEDFYVGIGGTAKKGKTQKQLQIERQLYNLKFDLDIESDAQEIAYQLGVISEEGTKRIIEYAFKYARKNNRQRVTGVDKANVLSDIYGFWREKMEQTSKNYPNIEHEFNYVDAATMWFVKNPEYYEVVVTPNMFGDIITDLGAMMQGGLGLAPGGNINPEGTSMFEPIHGSAPKHAGKNKVNPIATIWAGALLLEHLGETQAKKDIIEAISKVTKRGKTLTYDLGGNSTTKEVGSAIANEVKKL